MKFFQEVHGLSTASGKGPDVMHMILEKTHCTAEVHAVQAASLAGMAALQDGSCAGETLQEHVAAVYASIERALNRGARQGNTEDAIDCSDRLMYIRAWRPDLEPDLREMYEDCRRRPAWTVAIAMDMETIHEAATRALKSGKI